MKTITIISLILFSLTNIASGAITVSFDELSTYTDTTSAGSYYNGYGLGATTSGWQTQGLSFNTHEYGPGWSFSNVNDTTTAGYTNPFASATGTGIGGTGNYAIAFDDGAFFNLPTDQRIDSLSISNTTYAYLAMRNGYYNAKAFGGVSGSDPDFFKVTFNGFSALNAAGSSTGSAEFYLADFRDSNNALDYIVNDWRLVDLTGLGNARSVSLTFDGSDMDIKFGLNTPAFAAFDNITFTSVPEPSSFALLSCAAMALTLHRSGRKRFRASAQVR